MVAPSSRKSLPRIKLSTILANVLTILVLCIAALLYLTTQALSDPRIHLDSDPGSINSNNNSHNNNRVHPIINTLIQSSSLANTDAGNNLRVQQQQQKQQQAAAASAQSNTPQTFPPPTHLAGPHAQITIQPTFGTHRPSRDAIFAFAEGYPLPVYAGFVESLRLTGYDGDVVLGISSRDKLAPHVERYLHTQPNVVAYMVDWDCYKKSGDKIKTSGKESTTNNGFSDCRAKGLYGDASKNNGEALLDDPRPARPVATARYELYWIWSAQYERKSRLMLIDVRDTYFQRNPFESLPKRSYDDIESDVDNEDIGESRGGGVLHLYEENAFSTSAARSIGDSTYNSRWVRSAYGQKSLNAIKDNPVLCSGATIGDAPAIEAYLRAMVAQFDKTRCRVPGCDQGLHNYLYYSGILGRMSEIRKIITYKQGEGVVNNLAALRNSDLRSQGALSKEGTESRVLNWDGSVSPVAHQYDRDKEMKRIVNGRIKEWIAKLDI